MLTHTSLLLAVPGATHLFGGAPPRAAPTLPAAHLAAARTAGFFHRQP